MLAKPQGFPRKLGGCAGLDPRLRSAVSAGVGDGERGLRRGLRAPGVGVRPKWVLEYSPSNKRIRYFVSITYVRTGLWTAHKFCGGGHDLTVIDIDNLPELWLGKTHAMQIGYQQSRGDWLCFVDADVKLTDDCIHRAMAVVVARELDHLALFPSMEIHGIAEGAFVMAFAFFFGAYVQPWKAKDPKSSKFCGVGAFNLIRRTAYEGIGTHEALRLEIADDLKLGKLIKRHGFRQDVLDGDRRLSVRWQHGGLSGYVRGLEKNAFAGLNYSLMRVVLATAGVVLLSVVPFVGVLMAEGYGQWASFLSVFLIAVAHVPIARQMGISWLYFIAHPLAAILLIWSIWRSTFKALRTGHVTWRGTDYPLTLLRKYMV